MNPVKTVLAFDLGASSGRAIRARYDASSGKLETTEIHRFENIPVEKDGVLRWDFDSLLENIRLGLELAGPINSFGVDTWGVDFGLIGSDGKLLEAPVHYRDRRTDGVSAQVIAELGAETIYRQTGTQIMDINTLYQLIALKRDHPELYRQTDKILFMPDLFHFCLGAKAVSERTIASTSQALNPKTEAWDEKTIRAAGLEPEKFPPVISSGTIVGDFDGKKIIAVAGHDTQCAVAAIPTDRDDIAFLSCGTWSLLGTELDAPILTNESLNFGLSNEIGANGRINYLKNIIGLWLIQESRREWRRQGQEYSYSDLERLAMEAEPLRSFINPDAPEFTPPGDIPERIREYCRRTGQPVPGTVGAVARCIYESLALKYRQGLEQLTAMTGKTFSALHILGGGTQSKILCRFTADCCEIPVVAGPVEATALGNIIIQLTALGEFPTPDAGRSLVVQAETITRYQPQQSNAWRAAYEFMQRSLS